MTRDHENPPLLPPHLMPPLTDQAALERTWCTLMGRLGFATPQLWLLFVDGERPRHLLEVEDVPLHPTSADRAGLAGMLEHLLDERRSCAFLYARPGGPGRTPGDLAWARALSGVCARWPVHLANDVELRVAAPDDLAAAG
ncbi:MULTISPECIES: hypothetical protein [unclassified Nocardioides]|jgi:hypothetical protein|uniref:hypothetical protein n=1 Tax=unclassified Nocardioides TaxID=2615069 RepID=UPI000A533E4E|nr:MULTISPECIES: hypothetical protein [unclassified Nocardioides]